MSTIRTWSNTRPHSSPSAHQGAAACSGRWQAVPLSAGLGPHATEWDALNQAQFGSHPLLSSHLWNGLLAEFGRGDVVLWVLRDGDAVLAMCLLQYRRFGHWACFLPAQAQVGPVMIRDQTTAEHLLDKLRPQAVQLDLLCLDPDLWPQADKAGPLTTTLLHSLTMAVCVRGDFDAYWARRSSGLRQNLRRYERRAEADGICFEMRTLSDPADMAAAVARYAALESRGWKARQGTALRDGNAQTRFYTALLQAPGAGSQAIVHELWHADQLVASRMALQTAGMRVMLKTSYDETMAALAPGQMLLKRALQAAFDDPAVTRVEFYTDASVDQLAWASQSRWIRHLSLGAPSVAGSLWRGLQAVRQVVVARRDNTPDDTLQVSSLGMDEAWPSDVLRMLDKTEDRTLEASAAWYQNLWQQVFRGRVPARLWVLRSTSRVLAVLPLLAEGTPISRRLSAMTNYYTALFVPALARHTTARQLAYLLQHLRAHHAPLGQLVFEPLDPSADACHQLQAALRLAGFVCHRYHRFSNWYLPSPGSFAAYLKDRSANLRSRIKRKIKGLADAGGEVEVITQVAEIDRAMAAYWTVYRASWKQGEPYPAFIDGLAQWAAEAGALRLGVVWLKGQPIAAQLWLVAAGRAEIFKVAYDQAHKDLSPGTVLTAALLAQVLDRDAVQEVDFLIGDDVYKRDWMSHRRERWGLVAYNPLCLSGLSGLTRMVAGRMARSLRTPADAGPAA